MNIIGSSPVTVTENGTERELFYNTGTSGGSQTEVVANPPGEATADLEKLQVGSTIYSVASSGSDSGFIVATVDTTSMTLDKTWKQIYDASFTTIVTPSPIGRESNEFSYVIEASRDEDEYIVVVFTGSMDDLVIYITDTENGYPVKSQQ